MSLQAFDQSADVPVESSDHGGVGRTGFGVRQVPGPTRVGRIVPETLVFREGIIRNLQRQMRNRSRVVEKERIIRVAIDEFAGIIDHQIRCVEHTRRRAIIALEVESLPIAVEVGRIVIVCITLTEVTEPVIESLQVGMAGGTWTTKSPLTDPTCCIAMFAEGPGKGVGLGTQGELTAPTAGRCGRFLPRTDPLGSFTARGIGVILFLVIVTNLSMTGVLTGQERAPAWCADRASRVGLSEEHSVFTQAVDVGSSDSLRTGTAEFRSAQVIRHDDDHIGGPTLIGSSGGFGS